MAIDKFKDVTINGREFRIELVTALIGNWIIESGFANSKDPDIYQKIQGYLLSSCAVYREVEGQKVPQRIFSGGRWLIPDLGLEYDLDTVQQLFTAAFKFNFDPFFDKLAKAKAEAQTSIAPSQTTNQ